MTTLLNNRYQVIQVLGAGGFGETFLAEDTHMPSRRRCVIKQLKPIANDPQTYQMIQQRFEREAATLEYLGESSDQIPRLYAYFSENGQFYLVQEWIYGQTLANIVETQGYKSETVVREILLSLLSVLDYVHSKGIIHRDIKPDNIILRSTDNKPVLIDFGAVKETIRSVVSAPMPTRSLVIGTPGYMPGEQAIGRPVYATDIYSLGLTAIYLLTGKYPQEIETNQQTGEILWQNYAPNVSPQLAMVINQAIKPQASDRYSTASKMLHALKSATGIPVQSSPTANTVSLHSTTRQTQALSSPQTIPSNNRQKSAWIVASLVVGGLIGGVAIAKIIGQQQSEAPIATDSTTSPELATTSPPVTSEPSPTSVVPTSPPQQQVNSAPLPRKPDPTSEASTPLNNEPVTSDTPAPQVTTVPQQTPVVPIPEASATPQEKPQQPKKGNGESVPAFPTGTQRSSVEAVLGKPNQDLRGAWGKTRAVTYKLVPNQIDLGYLFDRNSGVLRQTEVAFAQSVDPQVMQSTLNGMLGGQATEKIQRKLQQIQQRQLDNFSFSKGSVKGQIVRQNCDFIYISIWDADFHDFVSPSSAKQCS
ncbi:protein kinase [Nostocaceae cyanobacterium CENA369]|uniref:non-specific serine/threonine protein kinase n=1 Tax=Dendronalium phyllosphericum CENA369 TaxID=1725256 RepID=A0A8J7HYJ7_9NOST|nr:serine/threonine-protein kinase [Dendronalium phyllosphericum]MBH8572671.1 protein kinase [Dendronalium phyllosphericum CENA369]